MPRHDGFTQRPTKAARRRDIARRRRAEEVRIAHTLPRSAELATDARRAARVRRPEVTG
jgi:hypothetical protein